MLIETIDNDLKAAMREKNEIALSSLRNLKSETKNAQIAKGSDLTDDDVLAVIKKKVKQHKDSIESFAAGSRNDLVEQEKSQMEVLMKYLPEQMSEAAVREIVKQVIIETSAAPTDFGKVMKESMARAKGQTDGSTVSKIIKEELK